MLIFAGILSLILWGALTLVSRGIDLDRFKGFYEFIPRQLLPYIDKISNGFHYDVPNKDMPAEIFFIIFALVFLLYCLSIFMVRKAKRSPKLLLIIILFSFLFRLILIPSVMIHENDIYRYLWDAKVSLSGINPYQYAPESSQIEPAEEGAKGDFIKLKKLRNQNRVFFNRIGHRRIPTIYPPLAQVVFSFAGAIKKDSIHLMKFIFILIDMFNILLIYKILKVLNQNTNLVLIYAWSPLVLKEYANSGHYDSLAIFFFLTCLYFLILKKRLLSSAFLALGCLAKFFPIIVLPFIYRRFKFKSVALVLGILIAGYLPFFLWGATGIKQVFTGLFIYSKVWAINSGSFEFLYALLNSFKLDISFSINILAKLILSIFYSVVFLILFRKSKGVDDLAFIKKIFLAITWLYFLSPVGNSWYYCWVIPFLCIFPKKSLILMSFLLVFNYLPFTRTISNLTIAKFSISYLVLFQYSVFLTILGLELIYDNKERLIRCIKIK